jgi:hypothetical protein
MQIYIKLMSLPHRHKQRQTFQILSAYKTNVNDTYSYTLALLPFLSVADRIAIQQTILSQLEVCQRAIAKTLQDGGHNPGTLHLHLVRDRWLQL